MNLQATSFLKAVLEASWQASLVIVLILLLRPLLGLRVPARWRALLWSLVLLRLLVPAFLLPPSPASLQNIAVVNRPLEEASLAFERTTAADRTASPRDRRQGPEENEAPLAAAAPVIAERTAPRGWWHFAGLAWAAGGVSTGLWILVGTVRLYRRLQCDSAEPSEAIRAVWERCCRRVFSRASSEESRDKTPRRKGTEMGRPNFAPWRLGAPILRPPRLVQTEAVSSPALLGVFRPVLLIPRHGGDSLSDEDWEHIFLHELAHFRRRDHWLQALQLLALCVHWFNPLVWLGFRYLRADRELAADEWALRHLQAGHRPKAYGGTLLKILTAQARGPLTPGLVGIMEDGAQMQQRLRSIVMFTPRRLAGSIAGAAVVLALAAVVLGRQALDLAAYDGLLPTEALVIASRRGDRAAADELLTQRVDVNGVSGLRGERTALAAATANNHLDVVRLLISRGADVNFAAEKAGAPLLVALRKGWPEIAEYLRSKGATCPPELLAAAGGDAAAVQKYLASGASGYDQVKQLAEVAAAHGHRELFAQLYDALKQLPGQRDYFPFSRGTFVNAVAHGHKGVIEELLARDPNLKPSDSVNRLAEAAQRTPGLREWLISKGLRVPEYNDGERLIEAAEREDLPEIRRLLAAGVDVNYRGESEWMPLCKAAVWGCPRAVTLLLKNYADPNPPRYSYSTLELAKTPEIADLLVAAGAKVKPEDIGYSIGHGSVEMVRWFLAHGVDPLKVKDPHEGGTLLFDASKPEIAELLLDRGIDLQTKNKFGHTALTWILQMRQENVAPIIEVLLKHGADPNARGEGGFTPLMIAPDGATVDVLVAAGAVLDAKDDRGNGVLSGGAHTSDPTRLEALRRHGLKLDAAAGAAQLMNAVSLRNDLAAVKRLLAMGVDPKVGPTWEGRPSFSPLASAISNGKFEIAEVLRAAGANDVGALSEAAAKGDLVRMTALIDAGADVNERTSNGLTPLHFAVSEGRAAAAQLLLERGANVNLFTNAGMTALASAQMTLLQVEYRHFSPIRRLDLPAAKKALDEIIAAIRAHHPDVNFRNEAGETALMCGVQSGFLHISAPIRETGLDINAQRPDGMTALMLAIVTQAKNAPKDGAGSVSTRDVNGKESPSMSARAHVVQTLLRAGADLTLRNAAGKTALDLARENGNAEILSLLEQAKR